MSILFVVLLFVTSTQSFYVAIECENLKEDEGCSRVDALGSTTHSGVASQLQVLSHRQPATNTSISSLAITWSSKLKSTSGFGVEIEKHPKYGEPSRQCLFVELGDDHQDQWIDWKLDCPSLFRMETGSYNVSIHLSPSAHTLTSAVSITEKIGDVNELYADTAAFWATDLVANCNACSAELTVTFELANPAYEYKFSKYAVEINPRIDAAHSVEIQVDPSQSHASHTFSGMHPGRYNITVFPVETSINRPECVCRCNNVQQLGCRRVPGCTLCMASKSAYVYVDVQECDVEKVPLNNTPVLAIVCGVLAAVVLLCVTLFVGLYKKPDLCYPQSIRIIHKPPLPKPNKQVFLKYWQSQHVLASMMEHLGNLLHKYCDCDVTLENPLREGPDEDFLLLFPNQRNAATILVLTDLNSDAQKGLISALDESVIIVRLTCTPVPPNFKNERRIFIIPDHLDLLCQEFHDDVLPPSFQSKMMSDPDDGIPFRALVNSMPQRTNIENINQVHDCMPSEYTCTYPEGTHWGSVDDLRAASDGLL